MITEYHGLTISELCSRAYETATEKGWHDTKRGIPEELALVHSEVSEALECYRDGDMLPRIDENGKPVGFASELADVLIRVADMAHEHGIDLERAVVEKMAFNRTRPYRHGGKAA